VGGWVGVTTPQGDMMMLIAVVVMLLLSEQEEERKAKWHCSRPSILTPLYYYFVNSY
jgi:hypothetical protein